MLVGYHDYHHWIQAPHSNKMNLQLLKFSVWHKLVYSGDTETRNKQGHTLAKVYNTTLKSWNIEPVESLKIFFHQRNEITVAQGHLMWRIHAIIPMKL